MSFGAPGGSAVNYKPTAPERGSFPLDHDGDCKEVMKSYLSCMKKVRGVNEPECRNFAKEYLTCRMDHNLMAKDEFKNLGFKDDKKPPDQKKDPEEEKIKPGELRW